MSEVKMSEVLESKEKFRYTTEPIEYPKIYAMYIKARDSQWIDKELSEELSKDSKGWATLDDNTKHFIKYIISFFAISDGVVLNVIGDILQSRIQVREVKIWYNHQAMMEDIHSIVYSNLVSIYVEDDEERNYIFNQIGEFPSIKRKIDWINKWVGEENVFKNIDPSVRKPLLEIVKYGYQSIKSILQFMNISDNTENMAEVENIIYELELKEVPLGQIILANAIMEGVFFSGSFCAIFWINHYYNGLLPGLAKANEWISRDEGLHTNMATLLYRGYISNKLPEYQVHQMFKEAVEIESNFIEDALPNKLKGINKDLMIIHIKVVADQLLEELGYNTVWNETEQLSWMVKQNLSVRIGDFFDKNLTEYGLSVNNGISFDENF